MKTELIEKERVLCDNFFNNDNYDNMPIFVVFYISYSIYTHQQQKAHKAIADKGLIADV